VILALVMMFAFASAAMAADTAKSTPKAGSFIIQVDGRTLSSDVAPMIKNGRTLAPIRVISEALGMKVDYEDRLVIIRSYDGHKTLELPIDFKEATVYIDGKVSDVLKMDVPAQIKNGRTLVPLRLVAEFFEADVQYVPGSWKTVKITTPAVSVNGQELNSMTMHTYMTMGGWIMGYWGNNIVGEMYNRLIAGIGEEENELRSLAKKLGIADRVDFVGWITDMERFFAAGQRCRAYRHVVLDLSNNLGGNSEFARHLPQWPDNLRLRHHPRHRGWLLYYRRYLVLRASRQECRRAFLSA